MVYTSRIHAVSSLSDYTATLVYSTVVNQAFHSAQVLFKCPRAVLCCTLAFLVDICPPDVTNPKTVFSVGVAEFWIILCVLLPMNYSSCLLSLIIFKDTVKSL